MTSTREAALGAVLAALRDAAPGAVSGEALAASLGVSRVAIGKRVGALREAGYSIEAAAGVGYRLLEAPDSPLPAEVRPLLRDAFSTRLEGGGVTGSTNDDAKALARAGAAEGAAVLASEQTAGRGRLGRTWSSPPGGVYCSVLLRPAIAPAEAGPLALVVGVGLARGMRDLGADVALKWPNDVLLGGGKLAGVLLEMSAEADRVEWVVAGFGVNVRPAKEPAPNAAYLAQALPEAPRLAEVAARCLDGVAGAYRDFGRDGFGALLGEYEGRAWLTGREVTVRDANGGAIVTGVVARVDDRGRLVVGTADGEMSVASGEVTLAAADGEAQW